MQYKDDWADARNRLSAMWYGERLDRPCVSITAPNPVAGMTPLHAPSDLEAAWLDPDFRVARFKRDLEYTWWGGECMPSCLLMANWVLCLGGRPNFARDTIWFDVQQVDFSRPSPFRHDPESEWTLKYTRLLSALCDAAGRDNFAIGKPGGLPANDLISMLMGTEAFMYALVDHPDWMRDAIVQGAKDQMDARRGFKDMLIGRGHEYWYGNAGWMPFWAPEPFNTTQSDVSCMLSPEMFDRFIVPELEIHASEHGSLWYHLDGGDARQHLPRLLSLPFLRVIQYTPAPFEPPNGPDHMDMYRKIQGAGKIVHIELPSANIEPLARQLDPGLLMLHTHVASRSDGERLLENCVAWAGCSPRADSF